jgi:capsular exopolysaccharide synthesis family protein
MKGSSSGGFEPPPSPEPFIISNAPIPSQMVDPRVVMLHQPGTTVSEKYRSTRTRLLTANPEGSARVFAIASSLRREGRTTTVANLGFSFAELRQFRVAMVDCDFRNRGLAKYFNAEDRPGLAEVIRGDTHLADACIPVVRNNLHLITAGSLGDSSPSDLLAGDAIAGVFNQLKERYHYCLIDTPPMDNTADIGLIGPLCHAVVVVIRMAKTPQRVMHRCVRMLQANRISIAGCVLAGYCERTMASTDTRDYFDLATIGV